jgi:UDP-2,4-diacetamido-2,4,6-trideoxy-beta-L-altropyranose hydrolase
MGRYLNNLGIKIAFRVDASNQIGTGHFMRCLALANALKQHDVQIRFISRHLPEYLRNMLVTNAHEFMQLESNLGKTNFDDLLHAHWLGASQHTDAQESVHALSDQLWDWLVVDHYALDIRWESMLRQTVKRILVIDDIADRQHNCDILLDQNYYMDMDERYTGKVPEQCRLLLGPYYALLGVEFRRRHKESKSRNGPVKRILVCFGGIDAENYTGCTIDYLLEMNNSNLNVDVVIGAQHPRHEKITETCMQHGFNCYVQTDKMAELMVNADLAIGAGGSATWERCCLGLPAIVFAVAKNQERASRALADRGVVYLGRIEEFSVEIKCAIKYFHVASRLHVMSVKAAELVDGQGAVRLSDMLLQREC